jgi:putative spermidine/putrescine transport system permease protein
MAKHTLKILFILLAAGCLFALAITILLSVFAFYRYPQVFPSRWTLAYWENMLTTNTLFKSSLASSFLLGALSGAFSTAIGFMTGKGIVENNLHKKRITLFLYSLPLFIPATALFIGTHLVMIRLHLNNTLAGVLLAHSLVSIPYSVNIAVSFFDGLPEEIVYAAKTLGATPAGVFKRIFLPLMLPSLALSFGICFLLSVAEYFSTVLIGGGKVITLAVLYYPYLQNADIGNSAVLSVFFIAINVVAFGIVGRFSKSLKPAAVKFMFE